MTNDDSNSDKTLLALLSGGDQRAFETLYQRYWTPLWNYAANAMADPDDAEDIVQELFMTLWEKRATLHIKTSLKAYLYRAAVNKVIDRSDRAKYRLSYVDDLKRTFDQGAYTIDDKLFERELEKRFEACLNTMPPKMRTIFKLSRIRMMSHLEISNYLHISRDNVNRQIKNALILLKKSLLAAALIFKFFLP